MSENDNEKLSVEHSPKTVDLKKKKARKINNWPILIAFMVIGIIVLTLVHVVVKRGESSQEIASTEKGGNRATAFARDFMSTEAGIVGAKEETPARPSPQEPPSDAGRQPATVPDLNDKPVIPAIQKQEPPRMTDEEKKVREIKFRQVEAAIDGPIKVSVEEVEIKPRSLNLEIANIERQIAELEGQATMTYEQRLASIQVDTEGTVPAVDFSRRGDLSRLNSFAGTGAQSTGTALEPPPTKFTIRTGSVIPATLISGINSDLPGQILGQVSQNVYDTPTGKHLLIPQGSRLVGEYSSDVQYGQSRLFAVWTRIIFPDGKALDLGAMPGSTGAGYSGFRDRVNNHYVRIFGSAILMSGIVAGVSMTQDNGDTGDDSNKQRMSDALSEALGQQLGGVMAEMVSKNMSIAPTIEIRPGFRLNVMLVKDLIFDNPYKAFDYVQ